MATYTSQPVKTQKTDSPSMNSNSKNTLFIILLVATLAAGGYGWVGLDRRIVVLETELAPRPTNATGRRGNNPAAVGPGVNPATGPGLGAAGPGGNFGGRRGGNNAAAIIANAGLDDATTAKLTDLATQRQAALQAAQADAANQGVNRRGDPQGYQAILDAATADIDGQIGAISPDVLTALQAANQGGRGGRRGGGGGGGGGGA